MSYKIRIAKKDDAKELLEIYAPYVENTAVTFECAVPSLTEFEERIVNTLQKYPYLVAEIGGEIVGYTYAGPFKPRAGYDWSVETSIYVREDHRGTGIGKELYCELEKRLAAQNIVNVYAAVAYIDTGVSDGHLNQNSFRFHEHMGFTPVGVFRKCANKFGHWYDLMWMEKKLGGHRSDPDTVIPFSNLSDQ